ncbi:hypothetical protein EI547_01020 [Halomonas sp. FME20]|uniref:CheW-like domain-containing protein n=2 Tax=Halomonadaceae TaxID=28256 RepID=A0ABR9FTR3_9GAMM|nr:hypothetical protein [Halomonas colorata]
MPLELLSNSAPQGAVPMVLFSAGAFRAALEARHVMSMSDQPRASRYIEAAALLFQHTAPATHWLTLNDTEGSWQLGVSHPVTLHSFAASELHPLPPLLKARRPHAALCGATFEQQTLVLLLDAHLLTPQATNS